MIRMEYPMHSFNSLYVRLSSLTCMHKDTVVRKRETTISVRQESLTYLICQAGKPDVPTFDEN